MPRMGRLRTGVVANLVLVLASFAGFADGQSKLDATKFVFKSTGTVQGTDYNLWSLGYLGTFFSLRARAVVTFDIQAAGQVANNVWPQMRLHVGNQEVAFTVGSADFKTYSAKVSLPAGTSLVRIEFLNDFYDPQANQDRNLILRDLTVFAAPSAQLKILNPTDDKGLRQTIFTAADSTIENYRKQTASVTLLTSLGKKLPAGTPVRVQLNRHAFRFGTAVGGTGSPWDPMWPNPASGSFAAKYQAAILQNFNTIECENAGKWAYTEPTEGAPAMEYVDAIINFAQLNKLSLRQHNLLWGQQQPDWSAALENTALGADPLAAANAKTELANAITYRTRYYVHDRAKGYAELDGINEAAAGHQPVFLNIFGYDGIAGIYNQAIDQLRLGGGNSNVYFNEYSVINPSSDGYANWYSGFINSVIAAGISNQNRSRLGIGIQYYTGNGQHDPAQIYRSLANLEIFDLPISLTEFGIDGGSTSQAPQILVDAVRLIFGTEQATMFNCWGFYSDWMWQPGCAFYDSNWNLTPAGKAWQQMTGIRNWNLKGVPNWTTELTTYVDQDGKISFRGFAGGYTVTAGKLVGSLPVAVGTAAYTVKLN